MPACECDPFLRSFNRIYLGKMATAIAEKIAAKAPVMVQLYKELKGNPHLDGQAVVIRAKLRESIGDVASEARAYLSEKAEANRSRKLSVELAGHSFGSKQSIIVCLKDGTGTAELGKVARVEISRGGFFYTDAEGVFHGKQDWNSFAGAVLLLGEQLEKFEQPKKLF